MSLSQSGELQYLKLSVAVNLSETLAVETEEFWIAAFSVLSDAIKIIVPGLLTALVAMYTISRQLTAAAAEKVLDVKIRSIEKLFDFYHSEMLRAEENTSKTVNACGQLLGAVEAHESVGDGNIDLSTSLVQFFAMYSSVIPLTNKRLIHELGKLNGDHSDYVQMLEEKTAVLGRFSPPIEKEKYKDYAMQLAGVFSVQGICYSILMENQAIEIMNELREKP